MISSAWAGLTHLPWRTRWLLTLLLATSFSSPLPMLTTLGKTGRTPLQHLFLSGWQETSEFDKSFDRFWSHLILAVNSKSCSITQGQLGFCLRYMFNMKHTLEAREFSWICLKKLSQWHSFHGFFLDARVRRRSSSSRYTAFCERDI